MSEVTRLGIYSEKLPSRAEDYAEVISARGSFQAAKSLAGRPVFGARYQRTGSLIGEHKAQYCADDPGYVIFSYDTPIAWHVPGPHIWRMPNVTYSLTTTQHQELIRAALAILPEVTSGTATLIAPTWRDSPPVSMMKGRGHSPYGPRKGGW